jgi:cytochrome c-type biogenesis protein CcmH
MLAELMIEAAGGYVSKDAVTALRAALDRDPRAPAARFYLGLYHLQTGRPDLAFPIWRDLLEESRPDAPWAAPIRARIGEIAQRAGVRYTPPGTASGTGAPGPSAADMQAAAGMDPEARAGMIRAMVGRLSGRLATEGGTVQEWARLVKAYGVLGETDKARDALETARETFADDSAALATLQGIAESAGVAQ